MITLANPPIVDGFDLVRADAPALLGKEVIDALQMEPEIGTPWPVYVTTISNLEDGRVIDDAKIKAWQYPVWAGKELLGLAHLSTDPVLQWAALFPPEYAKKIWDAMVRVQTLQDFQDGNFALRVLEIASVSLHAVWLHGPKDLFLPLRSPAYDGDDVAMKESDLVQRFQPIVLMRRDATGTRGA